MQYEYSRKSLECPVEKGGEDMSKYRIIYKIEPVFPDGQPEQLVMENEAPDMSLVEKVASRCEWGRHKLVRIEPLV